MFLISVTRSLDMSLNRKNVCRYVCHGKGNSESDTAEVKAEIHSRCTSIHGRCHMVVVAQGRAAALRATATAASRSPTAEQNHRQLLAWRVTCTATSYSIHRWPGPEPSHSGAHMRSAAHHVRPIDLNASCLMQVHFPSENHNWRSVNLKAWHPV